MQEQNVFWLNLHRLAASYDAEGASHDERANTISAQLELCRMVAHLPSLYTAVVEAASDAELARYAESPEDEDRPVRATAGKG